MWNRMKIWLHKQRASEAILSDGTPCKRHFGSDVATEDSDANNSKAKDFPRHGHKKNEPFHFGGLRSLDRPGRATGGSRRQRASSCNDDGSLDLGRVLSGTTRHRRRRGSGVVQPSDTGDQRIETGGGRPCLGLFGRKTSSRPAFEAVHGGEVSSAEMSSWDRGKSVRPPLMKRGQKKAKAAQSHDRNEYPITESESYSETSGSDKYRLNRSAIEEGTRLDAGGGGGGSERGGLVYSDFENSERRQPTWSCVADKTDDFLPSEIILGRISRATADAGGLKSLQHPITILNLGKRLTAVTASVESGYVSLKDLEDQLATTTESSLSTGLTEYSRDPEKKNARMTLDDDGQGVGQRHGLSRGMTVLSACHDNVSFLRLTLFLAVDGGSVQHNRGLPSVYADRTSGGGGGKPKAASTKFAGSLSSRGTVGELRSERDIRLHRSSNHIDADKITVFRDRRRRCYSAPEETKSFPRSFCRTFEIKIKEKPVVRAFAAPFADGSSFDVTTETLVKEQGIGAFCLKQQVLKETPKADDRTRNTDDVAGQEPPRARCVAPSTNLRSYHQKVSNSGGDCLTDSTTSNAAHKVRSSRLKDAQCSVLLRDNMNASDSVRFDQKMRTGIGNRPGEEPTRFAPCLCEPGLQNFGQNNFTRERDGETNCEQRSIDESRLNPVNAEFQNQAVKQRTSTQLPSDSRSAAGTATEISETTQNSPQKDDIIWTVCDDCRHKGVDAICSTADGDSVEGFSRPDCLLRSSDLETRETRAKNDYDDDDDDNGDYRCECSGDSYWSSAYGEYRSPTGRSPCCSAAVGARSDEKNRGKRNGLRRIIQALITSSPRSGHQVPSSTADSSGGGSWTSNTVPFLRHRRRWKPESVFHRPHYSGPVSRIKARCSLPPSPLSVATTGRVPTARPDTTSAHSAVEGGSRESGGSYFRWKFSGKVQGTHRGADPVDRASVTFPLQKSSPHVRSNKRGSSMCFGDHLSDRDAPTSLHCFTNGGCHGDVNRCPRNEIAKRIASQLQKCEWYWGSLGFDDAEALLANQMDGTFLVRDSSDSKYVVSISFRSLGSTHHTRIEYSKGLFRFYSKCKSQGAATVAEFIEGTMAASRNGHSAFYLRSRAPDLPPAPVQLLYPLSKTASSLQSLQHFCRWAVLCRLRRDTTDSLSMRPDKVRNCVKAKHRSESLRQRREFYSSPSSCYE